MAIRFESKKEGADEPVAEKAGNSKTRAEESVKQANEAANAPEMPFAKPTPRPKKGRR